MAPALSPIPVQDVGEPFGIMRQPRDAQQHGSCDPLWRPWSIGTGPSTLEGRREAAVHEYLYGMDRRPTNHEAAYVPRLAYIVQHLRDLAWLRRVRDRIDREYARSLDVDASWTPSTSA